MAGTILDKVTSERNFKAFLWHGIFLSLTQNFIDIDTIAPAMILDAGGNSFHIGLLTAIMLGGSSFLQIAFSPFLNNRERKKPYLITGILIRAAALLGLGLILILTARDNGGNLILPLIFVLIGVFSLGGSFAAISYTDILGKSMLEARRKSFFSLRQTLMSLGILFSAFLAAKLLAFNEYPVNYATLLILSGASLFIAMFGFLRLKEHHTSIVKIRGLWHYLTTLRNEIKKNQKLKYYLLLVNTLGISITILPFVLLYSKQTAHINDAEVGQFLVYKIVASVITGLLIYRFTRRMRYSYLLYTIGALAIFLSAHLIFFNGAFGFAFYFFLGGVIFTLYRVAIEGVLLEVSTNQNRAIYAGLSGAGNIVPALFPIVGGLVIQNLGFELFFISFILIISMSIFFTYRLDCKR